MGHDVLCASKCIHCHLKGSPQGWTWSGWPGFGHSPTNSSRSFAPHLLGLCSPFPILHPENLSLLSQSLNFQLYELSLIQRSHFPDPNQVLSQWVSAIERNLNRSNSKNWPLRSFTFPREIHKLEGISMHGNFFMWECRKWLESTNWTSSTVSLPELKLVILFLKNVFFWCTTSPGNLSGLSS